MRAEPTYATARTPSRHTDGPAVARAIERWLGRRPTVTQQLVLDVALERLDGPGSPFAYDDVGVILGRRCGKTVTTFGVPLARALAGPIRLPNGRVLPFKSTHTAQNLTAARQRFKADLVEPYQRRFPADVWDRAVDFKQAAADTTLTLDPRAGMARKNLADARARRLAAELRVLAPTPSSARGAGVAHLTWDEALTYTVKRGEELLSAARPTLAEMHGHGQSWTVSNVATDTDHTKHLFRVRNKGRRAVMDGRTDGVAWFEWSIPPGADPDDEQLWWRHYPALSDGIVGVRTLRRDREEFGPAAFAAEYLCRWPDENETGLVGWDALRLDDWLAAKTTDPLPDGLPAMLAVDVDPFGRSASIVAAVRVDDAVLVEVVDHRPGSGWVRDAVVELAGDVDAVVVDDYGAGHDLVGKLEALPVMSGRLLAVTSRDVVAASYGFEAGIREGVIRWRASDYHEALTAAAAAAQRTPGRSWQWERRVATSQTPLMGASLAVWALDHAPTVPDSAIY
jgi:hypothetical protein